ncbi:hypothetical protein H0H87_005095 [Tephrocybe sp. NHM501043]|nr:hypothetical protein H0H87_005095 [Tephrocybe sp. NHM501043]
MARACDPAGANAAHFCEHVFDRMGCLYNAPANAQNGTFESCLGENQDYPGVYTDASGAVQTFTQPPEALGPITSFPYSPRVPASSSCVQYESSKIYAALANVTAPGDPVSTSSSSTGGTSRPNTAAGPASTSAGSRAGISLVATTVSVAVLMFVSL